MFASDALRAAVQAEHQQCLCLGLFPYIPFGLLSLITCSPAALARAWRKGTAAQLR